MIKEFLTDNKNDVDQIEDRFKDILISERTIKKDDFFLAVLKKWNSASPKYPLNRLAEYKNYFRYDYTCGGGFFVVLGGYGLVIDPGYRFLETFYDNGFVPRDIDGIYISHAHDDHCIDLEPLFSVLFKAKRKLEEQGIPGIKIDVITNSTTEEKYKRMFDIDKDMVQGDRIKLSDSNISLKDKEDKEIKLKFLRTSHKENPWNENGTGKGLKIEYNDRVILYSSDTEYFDLFDMENEDKFDIMILNIGKLGEVDYSKTESHLGLMGIKKIIDHFLIEGLNTSKPLLIISEMGFELEEKRIDLINVLRKYVDRKKKNIFLQIIYSEPGIIINLKDDNVISRMAIELHETEKFDRIKQEIKYCIKNLFSEPPIKEEELINCSKNTDLEIIDPQIIEFEEENTVFLPKSQFFCNNQCLKKIQKIIYTTKEKINYLDALKHGYKNIDELMEHVNKLIIPDDQYLTLLEYEILRKNVGDNDE